MQLHRLELREIELPLKAPFETSFGRIARRRILLVKAFDRDGMAGFGECVAFEAPFFNHETIDTAWLDTAEVEPPGPEVPRVFAAWMKTWRLARAAFWPVKSSSARENPGGLDASVRSTVFSTVWPP